MKRTILLLALLIGGAFYLGWFTLSTTQNGTTEHVNIEFDTRKIKQDEARALEALHQTEQQINTRNAQQIQADSGSTSSTAAPAAAASYAAAGPQEAPAATAPVYEAPRAPQYQNPYATAPAAPAPPPRRAPIGGSELDERFE